MESKNVRLWNFYFYIHNRSLRMAKSLSLPELRGFFHERCARPYWRNKWAANYTPSQHFRCLFRKIRLLSADTPCQYKKVISERILSTTVITHPTWTINSIQLNGKPDPTYGLLLSLTTNLTVWYVHRQWTYMIALLACVCFSWTCFKLFGSHRTSKITHSWPKSLRKILRHPDQQLNWSSPHLENQWLSV